MEKNGLTSARLQGGLGNFLFEIACAYAYSLKHNKKMVLTENDSVVIHNPINTYKSNILRNIEFLPNRDYSDFKVYVEPSFCYQEIPFIEGNAYLLNYFQSEKYFKEYEKEIRELFSFPEEMIDEIKNKYKDILENRETCSIHVRRGNFLERQQYHVVQNINYYMRAIKKIGMDKTFLVFSDDILWCKEYLPQMDNFNYIDSQKDFEDLLLMSLTNHNVICNSSFSWWGSWLNNNKGKVVIAPKQWFGPAYTYETKDLYCPEWEIL